MSLLQGNETDRLATLGKVWFNVKYLHPHLAYQDADWDQTLDAAIPNVKAATGPDEFAAAVDSMLRTLDDPMTEVVIVPDSQSGPPSDGPFMSLERRLDGVVVVTLNSTHTPPVWSDVRSEFQRLHPALHSAGRSAVVFSGEGSLPDGTETMRIPLEGRWEAVIRLDEMILPDGSVPRSPASEPMEIALSSEH